MCDHPTSYDNHTPKQSLSERLFFHRRIGHYRHPPTGDPTDSLLTREHDSHGRVLRPSVATHTLVLPPSPSPRWDVLDHDLLCPEYRYHS